jgi:cytochrome P450
MMATPYAAQKNGNFSINQAVSIQQTQTLKNKMALSLLQKLLICTLALLVAVLYTKSWRSRNRQSRPLDWPVVGVLPSIAGRIHNLNDQITVFLATYGCSVKAQGPIASGLRYFCTCDPANVRHIFTTNHANYPKGEEFAEIFDIYGGSIFTVDGELCRQQRAMFQSFVSNPRVIALMQRSSRDKVVNGLLPVMDGMASTRARPFDMQDLINRLIFDLTAIPIFCVDPGCLSTTMQSMHVAAAMDMVMEVGLLRHMVPVSCWKLMRRLNIGPEGKLAVAHKQLHGFVEEMLDKMKVRKSDQDEVTAVDIILSADPAYNDGFLLSKTLLNYMVAGRDTVGTSLPWVFYHLAKNPGVVSAIRKELAPIATSSVAAGGTTDTMLFFEQEETKDLVYLQAALYESLRLHPPGPLERKKALADDLLPSGHQLQSGETVLISIYAMGRMESVWGKDCHEYMPERWLSEDGTKLRYVPSHKFVAFNSGPRMCLGKDIAITQMKTIVAAVIWNFEVEMVERQSIEPKLSCTLQMKNGLMMKVKKRGM